MLIFLVQSGPPPIPAGIDPFIWLVWVALTGAIGKMYLDQRAENKRKDELIDRLLKAGLENADANQRSVSLHEQERNLRQ